MFKLHNDPMVNESKIIDLLGWVWMYVGKRKLRAKDKEKIRNNNKRNDRWMVN